MNLKRDEKYNFDFAIQLNRWSMRLCGIWPIDDHFSKLRFYITLVLIFTMTVFVTIKCFSLENFFKDIETVLININLISTIIKVIFMKASKSKLALIVQDMVVDWDDTPLSKESRVVMISNLKRARTLTALGFTLIYGTVSAFALRPLIQSGVGSSQKPLPCKAYYPFNVQKSPNYEITYLSQILFIGWAGLTAMAINTFLTAIVFHLCGQLQVVALNVKYIASSRNLLHFRSDILQDCKCLHCIVERHLKLIRIVFSRNTEIIENSFNIMILMEVVITVMSLCIQGYAILVVAPAADIFGTFINIIYFFAPTSLIFLYAYIGENVIDRSLEIGDQVYDINWHDYDPKLVRSLMLIIIRSQRQLEMTAGKFFPMSLHAFKKILVSALSYATVLLASSRNHHH